MNCSPLGKSLVKQTKVNEYPPKKQINTIEHRNEKQILKTDQKLNLLRDLFSWDFLATEARDKWKKIKGIERETNRDYLI